MPFDPISYKKAVDAYKLAMQGGGGGGTAVLTFSIGVITLGDGESFQLARFTLPAGKSLNVLYAQVANSAGASVTGLSIEVYDATNAVTVYSTESNVVQNGGSLATSSAGVEIIVRINNASGAVQSCQGFVGVSIV